MKKSKQRITYGNINLRDNKQDKMLIILIYIVLGLIPLLLHLKSVQYVSPEIDPMLTLTTGNMFNIDTYYKFVFLIAISIALLFIYTYKLITEDIRLNKPINIVILVFSGSLILSSIFSEFKTISLFGTFSRNMGVISFLCFVFILFVLVNSPKLSKYSRYSFYVLMPVTLINTITVILKSLDINLLNNKLISWLILGPSVTTNEGYTIIGTLNHSNYTSGLGSVLFAFFLGGAIFIAKNRNESKLFSVFALLSLVIVLGAGSLSGMVTSVFIITLVSGIVIGYKDRNKLLTFGLIIIASVLTYIIIYYINPHLTNRLADDLMLITLAVGSAILFLIVYFIILYWSLISTKKLIVITSMLACLILVTGITFGTKIENRISEELAKVDSEIIQQRLEEDEFDLPAYGSVWGSGRLYIWKETIELSMNKPLLGYGFDTLAHEFDQGDPAKLPALVEQHDSVIVDKPHNIFLNIWYGAGLISLVPYLLIIALILIRSFRFIYSKQEGSLLQWPFVLGILAYLYQGLFNDPVHGIESMFWIFMGLSYILVNDDL